MEFLQTVESLINAHKYEQALLILQKRRAEFDKQSEFFNIQAIIFYYLGYLEEAEQSVQQAIELDKDNLDAHKNLIDILQERLKQDNASKDIVVYDTEGKETPKPGNNLYESREIVMRTIVDKNVPIVDIVVLGYNRLEKTKKCINSILKYTQGIDYQLILVNSGSSDDTLSFFESVDYPHKKIIHITKNVGSMFASMSAMPYMKAPYRVFVANDVYVTSNWLSNLLRCAQSRPDVGMICPMSSNTSNLQDPGLIFSDYDSMQEKAEEFNRSNPHKWEERMRLVTPCTFYTKIVMDIVGVPDYGFFHDFSDDDYAFRIRRSGYKTILCGDTFVCHDHDVFHNEEKDTKVFEKSIQIGRNNFYSKNFVDAWDDVNNFERPLIATLGKRLCPNGKLEALGIDVACGTPLLEIKNYFCRAGVEDVSLSSYTTDAKYYMDLKTICTGEVKFGASNEIVNAFVSQKFDCILLGKPINVYPDFLQFLGQVATMLKPSGNLLFKLQNTDDLLTFLRMIGLNDQKAEYIQGEISPDQLIDRLRNINLSLCKVTTEDYRVDKGLIEKISDTFLGISKKSDPKRLISKLLVLHYNFNFVMSHN